MSICQYVLDGKLPRPEPDLLVWAEWLGNSDSERIVARTEISPDVLVSTVFIGFDHSFGMGGPALLFESMVFGGPKDGEQDRYRTWEEAEKGHAEMVALVRL